MYSREIKILRPAYIENHICKIPMKNGEMAICDEDRFEEVRKYNWCMGGGGQKYPSTNIKKKRETLHKILYPELKLIDHINGDNLDNRSCNLRPYVMGENQANRKIGKNNTTGFKGVVIDRKHKSFYAKVQYKNKVYGSKAFKTIREAAKAYDEIAIKLFGEFARLNFPNEVNL